MTLTLQMIRCPDAVAPERREVMGGEFSIGRGPDNDWVLADPERHLSKRHCQLAFRAGQWQLADLSANGTYLNHGGSPLGAGAPRPIRGGDRISFGPYELEVSIAEPGVVAAQPAYGGHDPLDPFAEPVAPRPFGASERMLQDPYEGEAARRGIQLPADFDPLEAEESPFQGPTQSDHAPALDGAFRPPTQAAIPDDWDLDLPPAAAAGVIPPPERPPTPPPPPALPPPPPPSPPAAAAADESALLAAFLRGTGLPGAALPDPAATLEQTGAALRAVVSGIRQALIARGSIKGEFRIEQTMIRSSGNNPLKFSAGDDDAVGAMLGLGRDRSMSPAKAIAEALRDMRLHELATVTAMQAAVRALLAQFDPLAIERQADKGGLTVLPAQRKARAWDAFEAMHHKVSEALSDDFDSVFGRAFARAYEQAMHDLSGSEP